MTDRTVLAALAPAAPDTPTVRLLKKVQFRRQHPEVSEYVLNRMIDRGQIETIRVGSVDRIVDGSYECYLQRQQLKAKAGLIG
jgi:hypothetical protein